MEAPQVHEWGPRLWKILHSLCENSGQRSYKGYHDNEKRCWINVVNSLLKGLPCPACKKHFREYYSPQLFLNIFEKKGEERQIELRIWLWTFHNHVRKEKDQIVDITIEQIPELYAKYTREDFLTDCSILREHIRRAMFLRWLVRDDMLRVMRALEELWVVVHT